MASIFHSCNVPAGPSPTSWTCPVATCGKTWDWSPGKPSMFGQVFDTERDNTGRKSSIWRKPK